MNNVNDTATWPSGRCQSGAMRSAYCTLRCWRAANPELITGGYSAAALLARIQAERAAASGKKGKRGISKARTTA